MKLNNFTQRAFLCVSMICVSADVFAANISIPLQLGSGFLEHQALKQIFTGSGKSFTAWDDGSGCNSLVLSDPKATSTESGINLRIEGEGRTGTPVGEFCLPLIPWSGSINVLLKPALAARTNKVRLRVVDSTISGADGQSGVSGTIWAWTKQYVHPRLGEIQIDFTKPLADLKTVAPLLFPYTDANEVGSILESLRISNVSTNALGLSVELSMLVPERQAPGSVEPEPALSDFELTQVDESLKYWDVFVTLVAKQAALSADDKTVRDKLLNILLSARYEIVQSLARDRTAAQDPVRALFLRTWASLAPVLRQISTQLPGESALHFAGFIGAVDALEAIDAAGPGLDLDVSTNGLRRLARMLQPNNVSEPVIYSKRVDPELRRIFDFGEPLELPQEKPPPSSAIDWLFGRAWAQSAWEKQTPIDLNTWIPTRANIYNYLVRVRRLLEDVVFKILREKPLGSTYQNIFHPLMLASAWQETCWRQFILKEGKWRPITSSAGAVGIMQVSPRIWRGFYQPKALTWNINYNAEAGGEILHHYLVRYAIRKKEHVKTNDVNNLARATYSAYHGGPRHLTRYRTPSTSSHLKRIDQSFWEKYETVRTGDSLAVQECFR